KADQHTGVTDTQATRLNPQQHVKTAELLLAHRQHRHGAPPGTPEPGDVSPLSCRGVSSLYCAYTFAAADLGALTAQVSSLEAEVARIQAEAENKPFDYSGLDPDMALQGAIYAHRRAEFTAKVEGYARKFDELAAVISRSQFDAAGYRDRLGLAQTVEQMRSQLESRQVGSQLSTLAAMDSRTEMARALANAQQTAEGARRNLAAMTAERDAYIQGWRAEVSQK